LYTLLCARPGLVLFGEWLYAKHTCAYSRLTDYFLLFYVYDGRAGRFLSVDARDRFVSGWAHEGGVEAG
jgi:hypothetical protein